MSTTFTVPKQDKKEFKVIPEGTHLARCISWVDIGTHEFEYNGETKSPRKLRLSWETPNEKAVFKEGEEEQPFIVSTELTMSFHEKSNLFKMLSGWIGLTDKDKAKFNPEKDVLGKTCLITVQHQETKSGNTFAKVVNVAPPMKGTDCPKQINDSTYFFMGWSGHPSDFDEKAFNALPDFIQDKIEKSPEYTDAHSLEEVKKDAETVFTEDKPTPDSIPF